MTLILNETTAPVVEPVTLAEAKLQARVDGTDDDTYINTRIKVARRYVENYTNRAMVSQTWEWVIDCFPPGIYSMLVVPRNPLISVTSIKYIDYDGVEQTWGSANYTVDIASREGRIYPVYGGDWPTDVRDYPKAVTVLFVCGYSDSAASPIDLADNVPVELKQAMLILIAHMYKHRELTETVALSMVPWTVNALLMPYKNWTF